MVGRSVPSSSVAYRQVFAPRRLDLDLDLGCDLGCDPDRGLDSSSDRDLGLDLGRDPNLVVARGTSEHHIHTVPLT